MTDEELEEKLYTILNKLPDENAWLDYKIIPYSNQDRAEFIRDLCAFLNSNESYGKDKFIVFGINNDKQLIGLQNVAMQDKIKEIENDFAYILIYGTNTDRIYEINRQAYYGPKNLSSDSVKE